MYTKVLLFSLDKYYFVKNNKNPQNILFWLQYEMLPELNKIILIIALTAAIVIELTRLYMGYLGNLTGNVSYL